MLSIYDSQGIGVAAHPEIIWPVEFLSRGPGVGWKLDGAVYFSAHSRLCSANPRRRRRARLRGQCSWCWAARLVSAPSWRHWCGCPAPQELWPCEQEIQSHIIHALCATTLCVYEQKGNSGANEMTGNKSGQMVYTCRDVCMSNIFPHPG